MLGKRSWLVIGIAAVLLIGTGGIIYCTSEPQSGELLLSDYPELFERDALIIVGSNASAIELESAAEIASNLEELTGNEPVTKTDGDVSENDKSDYNLILVGTPNSNSILEEVCDVADATRATEEYPGENKGLLEILRNPWIEEKAMLLVEGSDEWGLKAGSERLSEVQDIDKVKVIVEWNGVAGVFTWPMPVDEYIFIEFSQVISGAPVMVDRPVVYHFDSTSGVFEGGDFEINENLAMVIGHRLEVEEPGGGEAGGVTPIYGFPSTVNIPLPWRIVYLDTDGTVYLRYGDVKTVLRSGEECQKELTAEWMGYEVVCRTNIKNHGFHDKSKIRLWNMGG